jgi:peptidoglycan/xylan/chitin deacetylase (PgdA/CDA1 family)
MMAAPAPATESAASARFREASAADLSGFTDFRGRHRFPHRLFLLRRGGPEGVKLAARMCGVHDPDRLRQLLLFAADGHLDDLPSEIFFDPDLMWHGQQLGMRDLVAMAALAAEPDVLSVLSMLSDLAQRIGLRREVKSRVENRVHGWAHLLVNGILTYATDLGVSTVRFPTSARVMEQADPARSVDPTLFERVYDRAVRERTSGREEDGWWWVDVAAHSDRLGPLRRGTETLDDARVVCVAHDIERDLGHRDSDPEFARASAAPARLALDRMLEVEAAAGVRATYNVVGSLWDEVAPAVRAGGHALGFHSHDHVVATPPGPLLLAQLRWRVTRRRALLGATASPEYLDLARCRDVDYRLRGYRPPQSRLSPGLHETHLGFFNFEWLASSAYSLGSTEPELQLGIVKIPIHVDDYELYGGRDFDEWQTDLLTAVAGQRFTAVSLHDCYAGWWLDRYPELLERLSDLGVMRTFDEVADRTLLASTRWI